MQVIYLQMPSLIQHSSPAAGWVKASVKSQTEQPEWTARVQIPTAPVGCNLYGGKYRDQFQPLKHYIIKSCTCILNLLGGHKVRPWGR